MTAQRHIAALSIGAVGLLCAACGPKFTTDQASREASTGRVVLPIRSTTTISSSVARASVPPSTVVGTSAAPLPTVPARPKDGRTSTSLSSSGSEISTIERAYEAYLYDLSGLDDNLNQSWLQPLANVTTNRLATAAVRQASALINAHEHGVGELRDDQISIKMTSSTTAALVDCQDEKDFYVVSDGTNEPDPAVTRADFIGAAELVELSGQWYVDVFTTTHTECTF